jgi:uncharacterized membrane protein YidH (DUF202 family)
MSDDTNIDNVIALEVKTRKDVPPMPHLEALANDAASLEYSVHRTKLSTHRTSLSTDRTEMSSRRTGMSFQRTRMSADRTLMSVMRTSLSLISFGFTIAQVFQRLQDKAMLAGGSHAGRNFGLALVYLGVVMTAIGIVYHIQFMLGLRRELRDMIEEGLLIRTDRFPVSFTLVTAVLLFLIGLAAIASVTFRIGPFD